MRIPIVFLLFLTILIPIENYILSTAHMAKYLSKTVDEYTLHRPRCLLRHHFSENLAPHPGPGKGPSGPRKTRNPKGMQRVPERDWTLDGKCAVRQNPPL